jgi:predicted enzyme related to lactoylglutathione lyase
MSKTPTGRFVWFEYSSADAKKAQGFYGELFGWKTKEMKAEGAPGPYTMIAVGDETIGGYWPPPPAGAPQHAHWISHLQVEDATASAAKVKSLGGSVKMEPMEVAGQGTFAVVADPTGAVFSLWAPKKPEGSGDFKGKPGTWVWNELYTGDPDKAVAFYQGLAGFTVDKMDMGPMGTYQVLNHDGKGRAGAMKSPMPDIPPHWLPYVQVEDADRTAERAKKLGGEIVVPPTDIPDIGRFAVLKDNQGAAIGILKPSPQS